MNLHSIGAQIRFYRQKKGLTQQELADKVGITWEMISRYERGLNSPVERLDIIAQSLDIDPNEFLQEYYKSSSKNNSATTRVPFFTQAPPRHIFTRTMARQFYFAPEWVFEMDSEAFAVEAEILHVLTPKLKNSGPLYVSPNTKPEHKDISLFANNGELYADIDSKRPSETLIIGTVLAQETRYK